MEIIELFENTPTIETNRLIIRRLNRGDAQDYFEIFPNENVTRYYDVDLMTSIEQAKELIKKHNQFYKNKWSIRYALYEKEEKKMIGTFGLYDFKEMDAFAKQRTMHHEHAEFGIDLHIL